MAAFREQAIERIRAQVGRGRVDLRAVGRRRLLGRRGAAARGDRRPAHLHLRRQRPAAAGRGASRSSSAVPRPLQHPAGAPRRFGRCSSASSRASADPEEKRKTIGAAFIDVFEEEAQKIGGADFLAQGTLYPDVIESVSFTRRPQRHHQDRTTTSAACRSGWLSWSSRCASCSRTRCARSAASSACRSSSSAAIRSRARASPSASWAR